MEICVDEKTVRPKPLFEEEWFGSWATVVVFLLSA